MTGGVEQPTSGWIPRAREHVDPRGTRADCGIVAGSTARRRANQDTGTAIPISTCPTPNRQNKSATFELSSVSQTRSSPSLTASQPVDVVGCLATAATPVVTGASAKATGTVAPCGDVCVLSGLRPTVLSRTQTGQPPGGGIHRRLRRVVRTPTDGVRGTAPAEPVAAQRLRAHVRGDTRTDDRSRRHVARRGHPVNRYPRRTLGCAYNRRGSGQRTRPVTGVSRLAPVLPLERW